eukprot:6467958-Amphidinium_carterae.2
MLGKAERTQPASLQAMQHRARSRSMSISHFDPSLVPSSHVNAMQPSLTLHIWVIQHNTIHGQGEVSKLHSSDIYIESLPNVEFPSALLLCEARVGKPLELGDPDCSVFYVWMPAEMLMELQLHPLFAVHLQEAPKRCLEDPQPPDHSHLQHHTYLLKSYTASPVC